VKIVAHIDDLMRRQSPHLYDRFSAHFVGAVADLIPYYRAARCVIAPMVSGRGISIKTIEALALNIPFVGTAKAFRGMPMRAVKAAGQRPFDRPEAFAAAIAAALGGQTGARNRTLYDQFFSREVHFSSLDNAVRLAVGASASKPASSAREF
jgi:polysaccharide biosynthesis protein PslH